MTSPAEPTHCEHCWHSDDRFVIRSGVNTHGPYCRAHPDLKKVHEHSIMVHTKKCCYCGTTKKTTYDEYVDPGKKQQKAVLRV